eukprot:UN25996
MFIVFEFCTQDMRMYLHSLRRPPSEKKIKKFMLQLISGIDYCHSKGMFHRDLKPQNILIDNGDTLKIADFGLSREHAIPLPPLTHEVITLWYRAPEILLGSKTYSGAVDMWSIGCIMAEFYKKKRYLLVTLN